MLMPPSDNKQSIYHDECELSAILSRMTYSPLHVRFIMICFSFDLTHLCAFYFECNLFSEKQALSVLTNLWRCQMSISINVVELGDTGPKAKHSQDWRWKRNTQKASAYEKTSCNLRHWMHSWAESGRNRTTLYWGYF